MNLPTFLLALLALFGVCAFGYVEVYAPYVEGEVAVQAMEAAR